MNYAATLCSSFVLSCSTQGASSSAASVGKTLLRTAMSAAAFNNDAWTCTCPKGKCREGRCRSAMLGDVRRAKRSLPYPCEGNTIVNGSSSNICYLRNFIDLIEIYSGFIANRTTSAHLRKSKHSPSGHQTCNNHFRTSPCFTMFSRGIASAASVPIRQAAGLSTLTSSDDQSLLFTFRLLNNVPESQFDPQDAWQAFTSLCDSGQVASLELKEVFAFSNKLANSDSVLSSLEDAMGLSSRLQRVVGELEERRPFNSSNDEFHFLCTKIQLESLRGSAKDALKGLEDLDFVLTKQWHHTLFLETYKHVFRCLLRTDSPERAFEFFLTHIDQLVQTSKGAGEKKGITGRGGAFFEEISSALRHMVSPAKVLTRKSGQWSRSVLGSAGRAMLHVFCAERLMEEALAVYEEHEKLGMTLSFTLRHELIQTLARTRMYPQANMLYASMEPLPGAIYQEKYSYFTTGLYLHAHQGNVDGTEECFSQLSSLGDIKPQHMNLLMHASAENGDTKRVLELFDSFFLQKSYGRTMANPNSHHYSTVIYAYARFDDFDGMSEWFTKMVSEGFKPDVSVYNIVMNSFAERGDVDGMNALLVQMRAAHIPPDLITYTTMIKLLAQRRDLLAAEAMFKGMLREGIEPDTIVVSALMNAHVEAGSWKGVVRIFDYLRSTPTKRLRLDTHVFNNLLKAYVLIGAPLEVVTDLFQRFETVGMKPTNHTFALLIQSACDSKRMDIAMKLFTEMEYLADDWRTNVHVNAYALTIIMAGYLRLGDRREARAVYEDMQRRGIQPTGITYGTIIKAYSNSRSEESLQIAKDFLASLTSSEPTDRSQWDERTGGRLSTLSAIYTPLMNAFVRHLNADEVERLYSEYLDDKQETTIETLTLLLDLYRRLGDVEKVHELWPQILELAMERSTKVDSLLDPQDKQTQLFKTQRRGDYLCVPLSIYIDAISSAGQHLEIAHTWNFLRQEGFQFDAHNWNHLVVALVRAGQPERAFEVMEKVILPYQEQAKTILRTRSEDVKSPLLYDDEEDIQEKLDEPVVDHALRNGRERARVVRSLSRRDIQPGEPDDFAHELHVMQQISPLWNIWRPHSITLSILSRVLERLHSGRPIKALKSPSEDPEAQEELNSDEQAQMKFARDILNRINANYPRAVQVVQGWEYRQQSRGRARRS